MPLPLTLGPKGCLQESRRRSSQGLLGPAWSRQFGVNKKSEERKNKSEGPAAVARAVPSCPQKCWHCCFPGNRGCRAVAPTTAHRSPLGSLGPRGWRPGGPLAFPLRTHHVGRLHAGPALCPQGWGTWTLPPSAASRRSGPAGLVREARLLPPSEPGQSRRHGAQPAASVAFTHPLRPSSPSRLQKDERDLGLRMWRRRLDKRGT